MFIIDTLPYKVSFLHDHILMIFFIFSINGSMFSLIISFIFVDTVIPKISPQSFVHFRCSFFSIVFAVSLIAPILNTSVLV